MNTKEKQLFSHFLFGICLASKARTPKKFYFSCQPRQKFLGQPLGKILIKLGINQNQKSSHLMDFHWRMIHKNNFLKHIVRPTKFCFNTCNSSASSPGKNEILRISFAMRICLCKGNFTRSLTGAGDSCLLPFINKKKPNCILRAFKNINFLEFPF